METDRIIAVVVSLIVLLFGLVGILMPTAVFEMLVMIIGILILLVGISTIGLGISAGSGLPKMALLSSGFISILLGLLAVISPYIATIAIGYLLALWMVINGIITIAYAVSIIWEKHRILTGLSGLISLCIGLFLFVSPDTGVAFLTMIMGIFFTISGILSLIMSLFFWKA